MPPDVLLICDALRSRFGAQLKHLVVPGLELGRDVVEEQEARK
jgi:hypothetical protein